MIRNAEEVRAAAKSVTEGRLTIWNARLELAIAAGDARRVDAILSRVPGSESSGGGCGCGCGCGGGGGSFEQVGS